MRFFKLTAFTLIAFTATLAFHSRQSFAAPAQKANKTLKTPHANLLYSEEKWHIAPNPSPDFVDVALEANNSSLMCMVLSSDIPASLPSLENSFLEGLKTRSNYKISVKKRLETQNNGKRMLTLVVDQNMGKAVELLFTDKQGVKDTEMTNRSRTLLWVGDRSSSQISCFGNSELYDRRVDDVIELLNTAEFQD